MPTTFEALALPGVVLCRPPVFRDRRGYFLERYRRDQYAANGVDRDFVQVNQSYSAKSVLRGMHYQLTRQQAKLVSVLAGRVYDVVVDVRAGSPTFGRWLGVELTAEGGEQLFVPEGYAHGFCVLTEDAHFVYQCSDYYMPSDEVGFHWASPDVGIRWPVAAPVVSDKDGVLPALHALPADRLPRMGRG
jgi:dTDP-4-dehydrorhamnose 3,5-epimerase